MHNKTLLKNLNEIDEKIGHLKDLKAKLIRDQKTHSLSRYGSGGTYICRNCRELFNYKQGTNNEIQSRICPKLRKARTCFFCEKSGSDHLWCYKNEARTSLVFVCKGCLSGDIGKNSVYDTYQDSICFWELKELMKIHYLS